MRTYHLTIEFNAQPTTFEVEQLDERADSSGELRYHVSTFNQRDEIFVDIVTEEPFDRFEGPGYTLGYTFTQSEAKIIATAIRAYNKSRKLKFDREPCDF